ncbi:SusC/RagA family TonB-linked outer membrane protein [Luteirhabdus pelagi]|uniref:SusC/RagA family TonB-linked outer membrane protein n=1 Tax=Luteirhabdus pelagi TaxID=2792783 RepID=UPI00193AB9A7|nr:SusC/RagA family TonB-linked outer membrane protein [Luteirhabdus pelagi]
MKNTHTARGRVILCLILGFCISLSMLGNTSYKPKSPHVNSWLQTSVEGLITNSEGAPLPGVLVTIKGTLRGTVSSLNGIYTLPAQQNDTLVFSSLGFITQTIPLNGRATLDVQMKEDVTQLEAVTLNAGYYSVSEQERTGSIAKVDEETIEQQPLTNPLSAIQGQMAGVEVVQSSGVPGSGFEIKIRGQNSIRATGNDPLYVIDGVPYSGSSLGDRQTSGSIIAGGAVSPLNFINAADIQSIEVLKDADATAIYGSRGANGVVLITTKKGKYGATQLTFSGSSGLGAVANRIDLLETPEYLEMRREAYRNDGIDPPPPNAYDINGTWEEDRYTDWQDELFGKTAYFTNLQTSVTGGNEELRYLVSGNYQKQTTVFPGNFDNDKLSVLSNLTHNSKDDRFHLQFSGTYTLDKNNLLATDLVREAMSLAPNAPELYNEEGSLNWENSTWQNPLRQLESKYEAEGSSLISNLSLEYKFFKGFKGVASLGYTQSDLTELRTVPSTILDPAFGLGSEVSSAIHNTGSRNSWIVEPQLHYSFSLGKTEFKTLIGSTFQEQNSERLSQYASDFTTNALIENLAAASNLFLLANTDTQYRYHALFGRLNINHKGKYIINLTGRRDGSSRFGPNNRFSNFGALGAAWLFSEEPFAQKSLPFVSFGKIRGSYGTTGNDQIGDYQYLDTYALSATQYNSIIGLRPSRLYNPDYSWEKNKKLEIALDVGFLDDRIFFRGSHYRNRSSNQLIGIPLPGTTGFSSITANLDATVENTGWEFTLNTRNIENTNFSWRTSFNITVPDTELLEFPNLEGSTFAEQLAIGESLNIIKVYQSQGVDPETGLYEFTDFNGDGVISAPDDRQLIKDLSPSYYGGLQNTLSYKNLSLDILFQFSKQLGRSFFATGGLVGSMRNQPESVLDRWQEVGDQTSVQRFTSGLNGEALNSYVNYTESDATIVDASYARLKNLSLNYQIPMGRNEVQWDVFLRGQNLWTITDYDGLDPETRSSTSLPPLRIVTLGTKITL